MPKIIAMIPARMGSKRVKNKNLRMIKDKPLINYIIDATVETNMFDAIYINSEADIFSEIADKSGIKFYKRPDKLASDEATNDDFMLDFMENVECDIVIQLLATSPFISKEEIKAFTKQMIEENFDTLVSVKNHQIECLFENSPINFNNKEKTPPSQFLKPVQAYACGIMGWKSEKFKENIKKYGAAYHGGDGKTGFFELKGYSAIDIDTEDDFLLAEAVAEKKWKLSQNSVTPPKYYLPNGEMEISEIDVLSILKNDGIQYLDEFDNENNQLSNIENIIKNMPPATSWSQRIINTKSNCATLVHQLPGEGNRLHYHENWNEWWYIVKGKWLWEIDGKEMKAR
ncbi:CMP-N-acetylneuraminic acid synthetase, partial [candidate division KSB1 bacterium]|nr:CMP-N-acetylneuraminic acid synthetase [candidate division KSB1 bacterium]